MATLLALIVVCVVGSLLMRAMNGWLHQTSAFYVGLPALLAAGLVRMRPASNPYGLVLRGTTLFLLVATIFAGEGFICVLLAAPLVYGIALAVAAIVAAARRGAGPKVIVLPALLLAVAATEGTLPVVSLPAAQSVSATRVVAGPPARVAAALARPLRFDTAPGGFLAAGFPRPLADHPMPADRATVTVGDVRHVVFAGADPRTAPLHQHHWGTAPSTLTLRVTSVDPVGVTFTADGDGTPIATWLTWRTARVQWRAVDGGTRVTWTLDFTRRLAPAVYWTPLERAAATDAAEYLLASLDLGGPASPAT